MLIRASSPISENIDHLTTPVSSHFLICGDSGALIDTTISAARKVLEDEVQKYFESEVLLKYILLTHAHFDNIGCVPHFKKLNPKIEIIGSKQTADLLSNSDYLKECFQMDKEVAQAFESEQGMEFEEWSSLLKVDRVVKEGELIDLGLEVTIRVVECPGHAQDLIGFYILPDLALDAGEALGGFHGRNRYSVNFASSYKSFQASLGKFFDLDLNYLNLSHTGVLTGDLARQQITEVKQSAENLYRQIKERLSAGETTEEIQKTMEKDLFVDNLLPEGAFAELNRTSLFDMINSVAKE